jgi:hypothetical protein
LLFLKVASGDRGWRCVERRYPQTTSTISSRFHDRWRPKEFDVAFYLAFWLSDSSGFKPGL